MIHVEDVEPGVADSTAAPLRAVARDRSYQELRRGAVTAYVRVPRVQEETAVQLLTAERFIAHRDDGDPDCPSDHVDLYIERHYGTTNPGRVIQDRHHLRITQLLTAARIAHDDRGGGVIRGLPIPACELHRVLDAVTGEDLGHTIRAADLADIDDNLALLAETLDVPRESLTVLPSSP